MESTPNLTPIYSVGKKSIGPLMDRLDPQNIIRFHNAMPKAWQRRESEWYPRYRGMVLGYAMNHDTGFAGAIGAFSVLSTTAPPDVNFALMTSVINHIRYGESLDGLPAKPADLGKALSCIACDTYDFVSGPKTTDYCACLLGEEYRACCDRHAIAIALGMANQGDYKVTHSMYYRVQAAYFEAAAYLGMTPRALQEWTWLYRKACLDDAPGIVTNRADLGELVDLRPLGWAS